MTSKDYLKQIAESKGICPFTNVVKDNALLFSVGFEKIFQDLNLLEELKKENQDLKLEKSLLHGMYRDVRDTASFHMTENEKLKMAIEILKDKINLYKKMLYSKEYVDKNLKGKHFLFGLANRNGQEIALNTILIILNEVLDC